MAVKLKDPEAPAAVPPVTVAEMVFVPAVVLPTLT